MAKEEKSKVVDLANKDRFTFLDDHFRREKRRRGRWASLSEPELTTSLIP
jgi:hypothetical protein